MITISGYQHMKKKIIKIMLAVIIFMMLVYRESLKESCLSYEKLVNEIEKICNRRKQAPFLSISYKNIMKFLDAFYKFKRGM